MFQGHWCWTGPRLWNNLSLHPRDFELTLLGVPPVAEDAPVLSKNAAPIVTVGFRGPYKCAYLLTVGAVRIELFATQVLCRVCYRVLDY